MYLLDTFRDQAEIRRWYFHVVIKLAKGKSRNLNQGIKFGTLLFVSRKLLFIITLVFKFHIYIYT